MKYTKHTKQQQQRDSQMQPRSSDESRRRRKRRNRDIIHAECHLIKKGKSATKRETREARCTRQQTKIYPSPTADG
jgi:hypothetical protein